MQPDDGKWHKRCLMQILLPTLAGQSNLSDYISREMISYTKMFVHTQTSGQETFNSNLIRWAFNSNIHTVKLSQ